jgi:hypothetical protein
LRLKSHPLWQLGYLGYLSYGNVATIINATIDKPAITQKSPEMPKFIGWDWHD